MTRRGATALLGAALALAAPASAGAATLALAPVKPCYRAGDVPTLSGSGFTAEAPVTIDLDGTSLGSLLADPLGNFSSPLTIGKLRGVGMRTLTATDSANPANVATARFLGSALAVEVRPRDGRAGRKLRIQAQGFTTGRRLYAHVRRRGYRRNVFIARLKGRCHTASARRVVLPGSAPAGVYTVQFDTKRRYSRRTTVWERFTVVVGRRPARAASQSRFTQTVLFSR